MLWKHYKQTKKVYDLKTHCRDECMEFFFNRYQVIMKRLKNKVNALPLYLTLQAAFKHIFSNVTDVVDTCKEFVKTHVVLSSLSFQASDKDGLSNYFKQVRKLLRRLEVLDRGKEYDSAMIVAQYQSMFWNLIISKRELRQIDKEWAKEDKGKPDETRFELFKE